MSTILINTENHSFLLESGLEISRHEQEKALAEFEAWADFCGLVFLWTGRSFGSGFVPFDEIVKERKSTDRPGLKDHYDKVIQQERASGELEKVALHEEDFTPKDEFLLNQNAAHALKLKEARRRKELEAHYKPISKRKEHWTLLGIKNVNALKNIVRKSFDSEKVNEILKSNGITIDYLRLLIARKYKVSKNRLAAANKRTTTQRKGAARKGHKTRVRREKQVSKS